MIQERVLLFFKVSIYVIYTTTRNYVCIDYLASESKKLSRLPVSFGGGFKHGKYICQNIGNWNSIFFNELDVLSWIFENQKSYCNIKMS